MNGLPDSYLQSWFAIYCSLVFGDSISRDLTLQFEDLTDTDVVGYFDPDFQTIGIANDLSCKIAKEVLLHEMIHVWDFSIRGTTDHGTAFQEKALEVEKTLGICTYYS